MMRVRILQGWGALLLILNSNILWAACTNPENCAQRIDHNLSVYRIDSCLYYSYLLTHHFRLNSNILALTKTWYQISFFNLLQKQFTRAQAARQIAEQYTTKDNLQYNKELLLYRNIFLGLYYYQRNAFNQAHSFLTKTVKDTGNMPRQLQYLLRLYKYDTRYQVIKLEKGLLPIQNFIAELAANNDTACFIYGLSCYFLGRYEFLGNNYEKSVMWTNNAIKCFESHQIFSKYLVYSYQYNMKGFWQLGKNDIGDIYFQRLLANIETNQSSKTFLPYYYEVKGDIFYYRFENREALNTYLKAYYAFDPKSESKEEIVQNIIKCYYYLQQYNQVVQWSDSCAFNFLDDDQKLMVAYSYYKIGEQLKSNHIVNQVKLHYNNNRSFFIIVSLAKLYFETSNYPKAEYYYKISLEYALKRFGRVSYNTGIAYSSLAYFYWITKADYAQSLHFYHHNVYSLIPVKYCKDYYVLPDISKSIDDKALASALNNKAEALYEVSKSCKTKKEKLRDLQASFANLELALTVAHRYKMNLSRDDQRYDFADYTKRKYPYIINVCLDLYHITGQQAYIHKAFEYAEKSKASLLLSTVRGVNAYKMHLVPDSLKKVEDQLWTKTELMSIALSWEYNLERINECQNKLYQLKQEQESLIHIYKQHYPAYYQAKFNAEVISADSLQKLLAPNEAALQYSLSNERIITFLLTRSEIKIFTDTLKSDFFNDIETYRKKLSGFSYKDLTDTAIRSYASLSNRLYNRLVKPAEPYIKGKKLLIIPDDVLTQVPFESLVTAPLSATEPGSLRNLAYLVKQHAIIYSYSGTLYAMNHQKSVYRKARLLAVAPSYRKMKFGQLTFQDTANMHRDSAEILPIPGTFDEVKGVHHIFGGKILMKTRATEKRFKDIAGQYDILHLATHGIINNEYPMFSKLVFIPGKDSVNNGLLNTYEIYNMQINAPLVVLSACNTGYGKLHKGEGIISLARGFFTAGAKSIVMTLWAIGDKTSSKLMHYFYTNMAANQNIGDAMQKAKLEYLCQIDEMKAHPYFWAGYIVLGNANTTFEPDLSKTSYYFWSALGMLFIVGIIFIKIKRRSLKLRR